MKSIATLAAATALIASGAGAFGYSVEMPNLTFPPKTDTIVTQDCSDLAVTSPTCLPSK